MASAICFRLLRARHAAGGLTRGLDCRQEQRYEHSDDRNDHQQFDQCESLLPRRLACRRFRYPPACGRSWRKMGVTAEEWLVE